MSAQQNLRDIFILKSVSRQNSLIVIVFNASEYFGRHQDPVFRVFSPIIANKIEQTRLGAGHSFTVLAGKRESRIVYFYASYTRLK